MKDFLPLARIHRSDAALALEQGVRGMGMRRSGFDPNRWGRWWPAVVVRGANGGPRWRRWAGLAGQHAGGDNRGPGWRSRDISTAPAPAAMASTGDSPRLPV